MPFCFTLRTNLLQLFAEGFCCIQYWALGLFNVKLAVNKKWFIYFNDAHRCFTNIRIAAVACSLLDLSTVVISLYIIRSA